MPDCVPHRVSLHDGIDLARSINLAACAPHSSRRAIPGRILARHPCANACNALEQETGANYCGRKQTRCWRQYRDTLVARAPADGYTLLYTINGPLVTAPTLYKKTLGYDPVKDLAPISLIATSPNVLIVHASFTGNTVADFIQYAKRQSGGLNYGSVGPGSASHLAMELFKKQADVALVHVPYAGFPQVVTAVMAQDIQAAFMVPAIAMTQVKSGKVKALGLTSTSPVDALPGIIPLAAQGFPGFEAISWNAVLAPAGTPPDILNRLSMELAALLGTQEIQEKFAAQYFSAIGSSPAELQHMMSQEKIRWDAVIDALKLSLD